MILPKKDGFSIFVLISNLSMQIMNPGIVNIGEKKLVGNRMTMSFADYRAAELWKTFMPRRKEVKNAISDELVSMVIYQPGHFSDFNPTNEFERWASVEVPDFDQVPEGMETFLLPGGLYAVFLHKGDAAGFVKTFRYIMETWLPHSEYILDNRPHFEVLGSKYKNNDPESEEEIWIPVRTQESSTGYHSGGFLAFN